MKKTWYWPLYLDSKTICKMRTSDQLLEIESRRYLNIKREESICCYWTNLFRIKTFG